MTCAVPVAVRVSTGDTDERVVQAIHLTINGMVAKSLGIGTGTVQRISGERAMSLRAAEQCTEASRQRR